MTQTKQDKQTVIMEKEPTRTNTKKPNDTRNKERTEKLKNFNNLNKDRNTRKRKK